MAKRSLVFAPLAAPAALLLLLLLPPPLAAPALEEEEDAAAADAEAADDDDDDDDDVDDDDDDNNAEAERGVKLGGGIDEDGEDDDDDDVVARGLKLGGGMDMASEDDGDEGEDGDDDEEAVGAAATPAAEVEEEGEEEGEGEVDDNAAAVAAALRGLKLGGGMAIASRSCFCWGASCAGPVTSAMSFDFSLAWHRFSQMLSSRTSSSPGGARPASEEGVAAASAVAFGLAARSVGGRGSCSHIQLCLSGQALDQIGIFCGSSVGPALAFSTN